MMAPVSALRMNFNHVLARSLANSGHWKAGKLEVSSDRGARGTNQKLQSDGGGSSTAASDSHPWWVEKSKLDSPCSGSNLELQELKRTCAWTRPFISQTQYICILPVHNESSLLSRDFFW